MPLNEGHDGFEDELGAALRRTGDGFAADDGRALAAGGLTRGRRRVRRRAVAVTGGVLALAVVGVGGVYAGDLLGGDGGGAARGSSVAGPAPVATGKVGLVEGPLRLKDIAAVIEANTPGDGSFWRFDAPEAKGQAVTGIYDDGKGKAGVSVGLYRAGEGGEAGADQVECPDETYVPHDACTSEKLPNGDRLMVFQGYEYPDRRTDTKNWRAVLLTKDGFLVDASEYNAPTAKDSAVTRTDPPFSPAQLTTLVSSADWRPLLAKLPKSPKPESAPSKPAEPPAADGADVRKTLRTLMPEGLTVVADGGQDEEFAYVVVDDGKGKSLVQINVQNHMGDLAPRLTAGGTRLPDGRLVMVTEEPGEKGGAGVLAWTAESLTPSGFRVVISAYNTGAQHEAATRTTPALTKEQLKAIALSDKWSTFETE
ncbi:hypothetical protein ACIPPS_21645 [Streptomyces sp. NPDC090127]|uniref:hypothetical protein n=1 Tax=Streptomyces sp. NPDC090127 TaxID=3365953 RepID=UPI00381ECC1D